MNDDLGVLYRYWGNAYGLGCDEFDNPYPGWNVVVELSKYRIVKETPKGAWIETGETDYSNLEPKKIKRFVLSTGKKRFAHRTEAEALKSFIIRKTHHISRLTDQLKQVEEALHIAQGMKQAAPTKTP